MNLPSAALGVLCAAAISACASLPGGSSKPDFSGAWVLDGKGGDEPSMLLLFKNGQSVLLRRSGEPVSIRGFYSENPQGIVGIFQNGEILSLRARRRRVFWQAGDGSREARNEASRVPAPDDRHVGLWRLNPEPDGRYLYIALFPSGVARNSIGNAAGSWKRKGRGILCTWPDGWRDFIAPAGANYTKRTWAPGSSMSDEPTDTSVAIRVGEQRFTFIP